MVLRSDVASHGGQIKGRNVVLREVHESVNPGEKEQGDTFGKQGISKRVGNLLLGSHTSTLSSLLQPQGQLAGGPSRFQISGSGSYLYHMH